MKEIISSLSNKKFKNWELLLSQSKERKKQNQFIVEGKNEISLAIKSGYKPLCILFSEENKSIETLLNDWEIGENIPLYILKKDLFKKLAYREDSHIGLGVFSIFLLPLQQFLEYNPKNILVIEGIEKPGNMGAIMRSAEALGTDLLIITGKGTDPFHPNVIRNSVGSFFALPFVVETPEITRDLLIQEEYEIYTTFMENATPIFDIDFTKKNAVVMGTESQGVSSFWRNSQHKNITIPMVGKVDSLNVATAAAIIQYERLIQSVKSNKR